MISFADNSYDKISITNPRDFEIKKELDQADELIETNPQEALAKFEHIISEVNSPRALYGKAKTLDKLADLQRSNTILERAIEAYAKVLDFGLNAPDDLFILAGNRCVDRMKFRGWNQRAENILKTMIQKFPQNLDLANQLGTLYLLQVMKTT